MSEPLTRAAMTRAHDAWREAGGHDREVVDVAVLCSTVFGGEWGPDAPRPHGLPLPVASDPTPHPYRCVTRVPCVESDPLIALDNIGRRGRDAVWDGSAWRPAADLLAALFDIAECVPLPVLGSEG